MAVDIKEVAPNIYQIDDEVCSVSGLGAVYLINEDRKALIDSGPPNSAGYVLEGIERVGLRPEDIDYIIVTHVHLDHAGGAGVLLKSMPRARVAVHHRGAKYLAQLEKLVESAIKAQGNGIINQYGEVLPVAPERIWAVGDGDSIPLSEAQTLEVIDAPGHAPHEICLRETRSGGVFTGDALGMYLGDDGNQVLLQIHPPPSFDLEACLKTVERVKNYSPAKLYFAHFGATDQTGEVLDRAISGLRSYINLLESVAAENNMENLKKMLMSRIMTELEPLRSVPSLYKFIRESLISSFLDGFTAYYQKKYNVIISR